MKPMKPISVRLRTNSVWGIMGDLFWVTNDLVVETYGTFDIPAPVASLQQGAADAVYTVVRLVLDELP